jgi:hypothetical protein
MSASTRSRAQLRGQVTLAPASHCLTLVLALTFLACSVPAFAQAERAIRFSIPPQPLSSAVIEFSHQASVQVLTAGSRLAGVDTPGVMGRYTLTAAVAHLLAGTGFNYHLIGGDTVALIAPPERRAKIVPTSGGGNRLSDPKPVDAPVGAAGTRSGGDPQINPDMPALAAIVVTGSRIHRLSTVTANPVLTVSHEQIMTAGDMTLGKLVQNLPVMTGGASNPQYAFSHGGTELSMRGLGPDRTLILVDGRRVLSQDVDSIPAAMIARIQVLKNGASAVYGSDAIGGVVNFITRKHYSGAQLTARYGESSHGDALGRGFTFTFGQMTGKGSIIGGIGYNRTNGVPSGARSYTRNVLDLNTAP